MLRLFADARLSFLTVQGRKATMISDLEWASTLKWIVPYLRDVDGNDGDDGGAVQSTGNTDDDNFRRISSYLFDASIAWQKSKDKKEKKQFEPPTSLNEKKEFTVNTCVKVAMNSQVYKYAKILLPYDIPKHSLDTRPYDVFIALSEKYGDATSIMPNEDPLKVLSTSYLSPKRYFEQEFFKTRPASRVRGQTKTNRGKLTLNPFIVALKLATNALLFADSGNKKRRRTTTNSTVSSSKSVGDGGDGDSGGTSSKGKKKKKEKRPSPTENTSVSIVHIYNAWCKFASWLKFANPEEMLSAFIYIHKPSAELRVMPPGRCVPATFETRFYVADNSNSNTGGGDGDEITPQSTSSPNPTQSVAQDDTGDSGIGALIGNSEAPLFLRTLKPSAVEHLRGFASEFIQDIKTFAVCSNVLNCAYVDEVAKVQELLPFAVPDGDELPERFKHPYHVIQSVRNDITDARVTIELMKTAQRESAFGSDTGAGANTTTDETATAGVGTSAAPAPAPAAPPPPPSTSTSRPLPQHNEAHTCEAGACDCDELRDEVEEALDPVCSILQAPMSQLLHSAKRNPLLGSLEGKAQFILTDPPYNVRRENSHPNSDYDNLSHGDMQTVVRMCAELLRPGGHLVMFCSVRQFVIWQNLFQEYVTAPGDPPVFQVSPCPLLLIPEAGAGGIVPYHSRVTHKNIAEFAIHATRVRRGNKKETVNMVSWQHHGFVHSTHAPHYNVIDGIPRFAQGERLVATTRGTTESARAAATTTTTTTTTSRTSAVQNGQMLRAEQKNLALCMELVKRYSKPGDIVVDFFAGTCTTAVACISLLQVRKFVGCDIDGSIVSAGQRRVLNSFIANAANGHVPSGVYVNDDLRDKVLTLYRRNKYGVAGPAHVVDTEAVRVASSSAQHADLPRTQRLPPTLLRYLAGLQQEDKYLAAETRTRTLDKWSPYMYGQFCDLHYRDIRNFLAANASLYVKEAASATARAVLGNFPALRRRQGAEDVDAVLAATDFSAGALLGSVCGTLFYGSWNESTRNKCNLFTLGLFSVSRRHFNETSIQLLKPGSVLQAGPPPPPPTTTAAGTTMGTAGEEPEAGVTGQTAETAKTAAASAVVGDVGRSSAGDRGSRIFHRVYMVPNSGFPLATAKVSASDFNAVYRIRSPKTVTLDMITAPFHAQVYATKNIDDGDEIRLSPKPVYTD